MAVEDWNEDDTLNGTLEGEDLSEGCEPQGLNDAIRKMASSIKIFFNKALRHGDNVKFTAAGAADPYSVHAENDLWIEYTP